MMLFAVSIWTWLLAEGGVQGGQVKKKEEKQPILELRFGGGLVLPLARLFMGAFGGTFCFELPL